MDIALSNNKLQYFSTQNKTVRMLYKFIILSLIFFFTFVNAAQNQCQRLAKKVRQLRKTNETQLEKQAQQLLSKRPQCLIQLSPRYYWGQNMTHIMVLIQFVTSTDTSACHTVLYRNTSVIHSGFNVSIMCLQSDLILHYHLDVTTFKGLNFYHYQWRNSDQNSIIFECLKSPSPYFWNLLHSRTVIPKRKPKTWWAIYEKYRNTIENYMGHLQIQEQDYDISKYKVSSFINNKKKRKIQNKQHPDIQFYCKQGNPYYLGSWL